jgi:hypothetical protein
MATFPSIYRAKVVRIGPTSIQAFVPQVFGDTPITVVNFLGPVPSQVGMGWVSFQSGNPDFPVWLSAGIAAEVPPPAPGGADEVWISSTQPSDPGLELWYDPSAEVPISGQAFVFIQAVASAVWTIDHPLDFRPNVTVIDSSGEQVEGDVVYVNDTTVRVTFSAAFSGTAYLS